MSNPVGELRKKKNKSDVEQSFLDFVDDKNLYIEEQNKLWEFWEKGGSPFVKELDKKGRAYYTTAKISDDGYYRFEDIPDTLNIYSKDPITQFFPISTPCSIIVLDPITVTLDTSGFNLMISLAPRLQGTTITWQLKLEKYHKIFFLIP